MALGATPSSLPFRLVLPPAVGSVFTNHHRGSWSSVLRDTAGWVFAGPSFRNGPCWGPACSAAQATLSSRGAGRVLEERLGRRDPRLHIPEGQGRFAHRLQPPTDRGSAVAPHAPPAQTNPVHLGYGCTGWENHLSIESNGPQRISVSHPGSHFGRFRRPAGYGVMGGRPRRSPHPQEVPQAGSAAQRRPAGARGAGR